MRNVFGIAILLSSLLLQVQAEMQDKAQYQEEESVSRDAVIYFYRMKSFTDSVLNPTIYTSGRPLVKLEKNRFFALPVPAGTHYFSWSDQPKKGEEAWVTVDPGQMVFFKIRWREIKPTSEASATRDMRNLTAVEIDNIFDPTVERTALDEMRVALQSRLAVQEVDEYLPSSEIEAALTVSRAQASGPFGLRMGMSRVEIESVIGAPIKPVESNANLFSTATVPRPSDRVEHYVLLVLPNAGLCQIRAAEVDISSSSHGVELRNAYEDLRDAVANAYGQYGEVNFLRSGSIWDEPEDWMMGLLRNERILQADWASAEGSSMRNDVKEVLLTARAQSRSEGYLLLQYKFENEDECTAEMNKAAQEVF